MGYIDKEKQRQAQHESYLRNKTLIQERFSTRRNKIRRLVQETKGNGPCLDCELEWPSYVLDYHHRDPSQKVGSIRQLVAEGRSREVILAEIEKCDLLCANCHRIREYGSTSPVSSAD